MPKSWSWSVTLAAAVASDATVEIPTPGLDLAVADLNTAGLAVGNAVVAMPDGATVDFGDGSKAIVTNTTGAEWPLGETVYLYVASKALADAAGATQDQIADLDARVTDLDARVTALEPPAQRSSHERKVTHGKR